jgi:hypothetical protein
MVLVNWSAEATMEFQVSVERFQCWFSNKLRAANKTFFEKCWMAHSVLVVDGFTRKRVAERLHSSNARICCDQQKHQSRMAYPLNFRGLRIA